MQAINLWSLNAIKKVPLCTDDDECTFFNVQIKNSLKSDDGEKSLFYRDKAFVLNVKNVLFCY